MTRQMKLIVQNNISHTKLEESISDLDDIFKQLLDKYANGFIYTYLDTSFRKVLVLNPMRNLPIYSNRFALRYVAHVHAKYKQQQWAWAPGKAVESLDDIP